MQPVWQDTPFHPLFGAPAGTGVGWTVQALPFQPSARFLEAVLVENAPTAVQALGVVHHTPMSEPPLVAPDGRLTVSGFHFVPSQPSAMGCWITPDMNRPTAVQALAVAHDTLINVGWFAPGGVGVVWIVQAAPFQRSASVDCVVIDVDVPTAVQAVLDVHDTPSNSLAAAPLGSGLVWTFQLVPFQRSARVDVPAGDDRVLNPTAVQSVAETHETRAS